MKNPLLLSSALALGLVAGAAALPHVASAAADDGSRMGTHERRHDWGGEGKRHADRGHGRALEHVDGGLAFVKAELKITPEQETAWAPFEAAVREQADLAKKAIEAHKAQISKDSVTLPERLTMAEQRLNFRLTAVKAISEKTDNLYAALSDEQKKTADDLLPSPMLPFPL